ncbi:MAG: nuclear transport factor 2 family protein [Gammaproteobacteria bacterium]|jgi:steroid Delta-isomerase|nr:nuclear transport factor 2 family protein [Gammaproteobacteria bacterium]MBT4494761.1 nuclear transport factor 2 family protein [Gammaproteobacteria bacterium]MBT7371123.1 nuclear transport factor 2 family protein [Gammaproteobacteria bacterium]
MERTAKETIEEFWRIQDDGDYTQLVQLFTDDAVLVDPFFGEFQGKEAIAGFMAKMNDEMKAREMHFVVREIDGAGEVAWAQWIAKTPEGDVEGCGLYRVRDGKMTYYKDYMNAPQSAESEISS